MDRWIAARPADARNDAYDREWLASLSEMIRVVAGPKGKNGLAAFDNSVDHIKPHQVFTDDGRSGIVCTMAHQCVDDLAVFNANIGGRIGAVIAIG